MDKQYLLQLPKRDSIPEVQEHKTQRSKNHHFPEYHLDLRLDIRMKNRVNLMNYRVVNQLVLKLTYPHNLSLLFQFHRDILFHLAHQKSLRLKNEGLLQNGNCGMHIRLAKFFEDH